MNDESTGLPAREREATRAIRAAYQTAMTATATAGEHPGEDAWVRLTCGEATPDERERLADHAVRCAVCATVYRALRELHAEARRFDPDVPAWSAPGGRLLAFHRLAAVRPPVRLLGAAAAAVVVVVAGSVAWRIWRSPAVPPPSPVVEQEPLGTARRSGEPARMGTRLPLEKPPLKLPLAAAVVLRGQGSRGPAFLGEFGRAIEPYRADRFEEAVTRLTELTRSYPDSREAWFYLGVSLLFVNRPAEASAALARASGSEVLRDELTWYRAVAAERSGDRAGARARLEPLCHAVEGAFRQRACEALSALSEPR